MTLDEFLATYDPDGERTFEAPVAAKSDGQSAKSPFIVVKHGKYAVVLNPMVFDDSENLKGHLCVDVHPFVDGESAKAGVFGMTNGYRYELAETGTTSHGWNSAALVAVLVGEQEEVKP